MSFYLANVPIEYPVTLDSPIFERQAGRMFVVGKVVASASNDWASGVLVSVAWDQVTQYMVFDSEKDFTSRIGS